MDTRNPQFAVGGIHVWRGRGRGRGRPVTAPRHYANQHHRFDHDQLVEKVFRARVWLRERNVIQFAPRPRVPAAIAIEHRPRLRAV